MRHFSRTLCNLCTYRLVAFALLSFIKKHIMIKHTLTIWNAPSVKVSFSFTYSPLWTKRIVGLKLRYFPSSLKKLTPYPDSVPTSCGRSTIVGEGSFANATSWMKGHYCIKKDSVSFFLCYLFIIWIRTDFWPLEHRGGIPTNTITTISNVSYWRHFGPSNFWTKHEKVSIIILDLKSGTMWARPYFSSLKNVATLPNLVMFVPTVKVGLCWAVCRYKVSFLQLW